jgi:hypothetical protein
MAGRFVDDTQVGCRPAEQVPGLYCQTEPAENLVGQSFAAFAGEG